MPPLTRHRLAVGAARHDRVQRVGGPARDELLAGLDQGARGGAEQLRGAIADDHAAGLEAVAAGELQAQLGAAQVRIAVQAGAGGEGDRVDDVGMGQLRPRRLREVEREHPGERLAPPLGRFFAQPLVDLLLGEALELAVVVG